MHIRRQILGCDEVRWRYVKAKVLVLRVFAGEVQ